MLKKIFVISFLAILSFCAYIYFYPVVTNESGLILEVTPGTSKRTFLKTLKQAGLIQFNHFYSLLIFPVKSSKLKAGEYLFKKGSTLYSIWQQVISGKGLVIHSFTIVPGWTFKQLRLALNATENLHHTIDGLSDQDIMQKINAAVLEPEGEFFPDTYHYNKNNDDLLILKKAYQLMQSHLSSAWNLRQWDVPYENFYQALIAASLIEKEAYLESEKPTIAGVLANRLNQNMLLQFDPSVIYGMGDTYKGRIYKQNLEEDTPYNTYVHKGLPPTPIAMPSLSSINAVLHPEQHNYFYFVARGDGSHQFSASLIEHHKAVLNEKVHNQNYFNVNKIVYYLNHYYFKS